MRAIDKLFTMLLRCNPSSSTAHGGEAGTETKLSFFASLHIPHFSEYSRSVEENPSCEKHSRDHINLNLQLGIAIIGKMSRGFWSTGSQRGMGPSRCTT